MIRHIKSIPEINGFYADESQGSLYYLHREAGRATILYLNIATLENTSWRVALPDEPMTSWYISHGYIFVNFVGTLRIYRVADGSLKATHKLAYHCSDADVFIAEGPSGRGFDLSSISLKNDAALWTISDFPNAFVTCAGTHILVLLKDDKPHNLSAYSCKTGEKTWEVDVAGYGAAKPNPFRPEEPCSINGNILIHQEFVVLSLSIGKLLVLDLASGRQHALIPEIGQNIFLTPDGLVYELTKDRYGFADLSNGKYTAVKTDWIRQDKEIHAGGALTRFSVSGNYAFACTTGGMLFCLDKNTGHIVWKQKLPLPVDGFIPADFSPRLIGDRLVITDNEGTLHVYATT